MLLQPPVYFVTSGNHHKTRLNFEARQQDRTVSKLNDMMLAKDQGSEDNQLQL